MKSPAKAIEDSIDNIEKIVHRRDFAEDLVVTCMGAANLDSHVAFAMIESCCNLYYSYKEDGFDHDRAKKYAVPLGIAAYRYNRKNKIYSYVLIVYLIGSLILVMFISMSAPIGF